MSTPQGTTAQQAYRWRWVALFIILASEVMDLLDATVVNVANPSIRDDLGGSYAALQWTAAGYTLAFAVGLITGGRLGDIFGRRRLFLIGAAGFTTASALVGLAQSPEMLIGSRVLQGAFGALMIPQGLGMIKEMFPPREITKAFGLFGPVMGLAAVGGPILAGTLIDGDLFGTGWRMIFIINLPIGLAILAAGAKYLPESKAAHKPRLDVTGSLLVTVAALLVIYPLVQGREHGWPLWSFGMMAASAVAFALFGWQQTRRHRADRDPLVVPSLFRKRAFVGGLLVSVTFFAGMAGMIMTFGLFTQFGLGYSPTSAGLAFVPFSLGIAVGSGLAAAVLVQRFGRTVLLAGTAIMAAGVLGVEETLRAAGSGVTTWQMVPALLITGLGMGLLLTPLFDIILAGVEPQESGSAAGAISAIQQLGNALGVAILGTIFFNVTGDGPPSPGAFTDAMRVTLWVTIALLAATFLLALLLPQRARAMDKPASIEPTRGGTVLAEPVLAGSTSVEPGSVGSAAREPAPVG